MDAPVTDRRARRQQAAAGQSAFEMREREGEGEREREREETVIL